MPYHGGDLDMPDADSKVPGQTASVNTSISESDLEKKFPNRPHNHSETFKFHELYLNLFEPLLDNLKKKTGVGLRGKRDLKPHEGRRNIIDQFISRWRSEVGNDIFPAFRLILCDKDRDRSVYGMKEQKISKLLVKVMKLNKESEDGRALLHWKQPGAMTKSAGDFALRCYEIIKKRPMRTSPGDLTIAQVNDMLDEISQNPAEDKQLSIMTEFYNNMNSEELMWLIRILLKQMKVGATEKTFFDAWHPDADALFNISSSLRRVCWELWDTNFRMEDDNKGVTLMSCFQPQLAQFQKKSLVDVIKAMGNDEFWIEEKLDGERMQMHYNDGEFKWWSRKAKEYTHLYGDARDNGSIARFTADAFEKGVRSIILDGEMITWDPKLDCIVGFGTLKTAAIETSNNPTGDQHRPLFRVFDILYINGKSVIEYKLSERRELLKRSVRSVYRRIEIHDAKPAQTVDEIEFELRNVIATSSEGLVIKNPRSAYSLNDRNNDWVKVKPEYMTEFGESLDCLVVGGYYGSGRRGGVLSSYLCALRVDGNDLRPGDSPMKFWSFFKVGGGFTAHDYSTIAHQTDGAWVEWDTKHPPDWLELGGGPREFERPDTWIHPEKSFVLEVRAASVHTTDTFRTGMTLRFPRFKKLRPDRDWRTALSIQSFNELKDDAFKERNNKKLDIEVRRGRNKRAKKEFRIAGDESAPTFIPVPPPDDGKPLFDGHAFFVMSESVSPKKTKVEIEALVKAHGGRIFQNDSAEPDIHVIGDRRTVKIAGVIKANVHDILRPRWIFDSIEQRYILPAEPCYLFHATSDDTMRDAEANVDPFGDSYARDIKDVDELKKLLEAMAPLDRALALPFRDSEDMKDIGEMPGWMFKDCVVYFGADLPVERAMVIFAGGSVQSELVNKVTTHVVVSEDDEAKHVRQVIADWKGKIPRVVGEEWVRESIRASTLLDEERFAI